MSNNWAYPSNSIPRPVVGCKATINGVAYTTAFVSKAGRVVRLSRDSDGKVKNVTRAPVGRIPPELGPGDVSPRYSTRHGRDVVFAY